MAVSSSGILAVYVYNPPVPTRAGAPDLAKFKAVVKTFNVRTKTAIGTIKGIPGGWLLGKCFHQ